MAGNLHESEFDGRFAHDYALFRSQWNNFLSVDN
jgi:hypothetical protein